jgi:hypothetical protein
MHAPPQHVGECWNAAEFFANKLFKELKGVDESTVAWVKALKVRLPCSQPKSGGASALQHGRPSDS